MTHVIFPGCAAATTLPKGRANKIRSADSNSVNGTIAFAKRSFSGSFGVVWTIRARILLIKDSAVPHGAARAPATKS
jgi:hypothetical protein